MDVRIAPDAAAAAEVAADWLARRLRDAIRRRGAASLAVSGGSTPAAMFRAAAALPVEWGRVTVWQVDERVAPDGDPARNAALLDLLPRVARVRPMPVTVRDLRAGVRRYTASLPERFDVVHLGLGDDGHTASWPPGDPVIDEAAPVALSGEYRGHVRMTLTPPVVNAARSRLVLAAGADKARPVAAWLLHRASLPVERVRRVGTVVVLDATAAAALPLPSQ